MNGIIRVQPIIGLADTVIFPIVVIQKQSDYAVSGCQVQVKALSPHCHDISRAGTASYGRIGILLPGVNDTGSDSFSLFYIVLGQIVGFHSDVTNL